MLNFFGIRKTAYKAENTNDPIEISPEAGKHSRTPSEAASSATVPPRSPDLNPVANEGEAGFGESSKLPLDSIEQLSHLLNPQDFVSFIKTIPPKTLHSYVLAAIPHATPHELHALSTFFATLEPPPHLHCVRCHKSFVEVENDDRSCVVAHDDESAEVERVKNPSVGGSMYQTLWNCCNKTVEGNGNQGPPDGFCYEGKHTTDVKRARFRADSTLHDDKLISCAKRRCFGELSNTEGGRARSQRSARRKFKEESSDDEELINEALGENSDGDVDIKKTKKNPRKSNTSNKRDIDAMEVEGAATDARSINGSTGNTSAASSKGKRRHDRMLKSISLKKAHASSKVTSSLEHQIAASEHVTNVNDGDAAMVDSAGASVSNSLSTEPHLEPKPKPRKSRKPRKSGGSDGGRYKPPKDEEEDSDEEEDNDEKPKKRRRKVA